MESWIRFLDYRGDFDLCGSSLEDETVPGGWMVLVSGNPISVHRLNSGRALAGHGRPVGIYFLHRPVYMRCLGWDGGRQAMAGSSDNLVYYAVYAVSPSIDRYAISGAVQAQQYNAF